MSPSRTSIKAVTFDLWETLMLEKDGWNLQRTNVRCQNLAQTLGSNGVQISVKQLTLAFKEIAPWLASIWRVNREVTHLDQIQFIIRTASKGSIDIKEEWVEDLSSAYVSAISQVPPYLNPDASAVLQELKDRNKRMGLICNTGLTPGFALRSLLEREGVASCFDSMLFSDELGIRKPSRRIFLIATEKLRAKPCEIIHVGDNLKSDVWGAKNAGFKAIYISTDIGRDRIAESDPTSLVSISRQINDLRQEQNVPDKTVTSLAMTIEAIEELDL